MKVRAGEFAQPDSVDPIVVLGDTSALTARIDIDERDVGALAIGAPMNIRAKAFPERAYPGTIREIARRMGRENVRTDDPTERSDTKISESEAKQVREMANPSAFAPAACRAWSRILTAMAHLNRRGGVHAA